MHRIIKTSHLLLFVFLCLFAGIQLLQALTIKSASLDELTSESALIVQGKIVEQHSQWDDAHKKIYTYNTLTVIRVIKGQPGLQTVVVRELGGKIGDVGEYVNGLSYLSPNDHVLLFLRPTSESQVYKIHSFALGEFKVLTEDGVTKVHHVLGMDKVFQTAQTSPAISQKAQVEMPP